MVVGNLLEICIPYIDGANRRTSVLIEKSAAEAEWELNACDGTMSDYDDLTVSVLFRFCLINMQWGFTILICAILPILPTMAFFSMFIELRVALWKVIQLSRRPIPRSAEGIGSWFIVIDIVAWISIPSNLYLCVFETNELSFNSASFRVWVYFILLTGLLGLKVLFFSLPAMPYKISAHMQRTKYLNSVLIEGAKEEEEVEYNDMQAQDSQLNIMQLDLPVLHIHDTLPSLHLS